MILLLCVLYFAGMRLHVTQDNPISKMNAENQFHRVYYRCLILFFFHVLFEKKKKFKCKLLCTNFLREEIRCVAGMNLQLICSRFIWDQQKQKDFAQFADDDDDYLFTMKWTIENVQLLYISFVQNSKSAGGMLHRSNSLVNQTQPIVETTAGQLFYILKRKCMRPRWIRIRFVDLIPCGCVCVCVCVCVENRSFAYHNTYWNTYEIDFGHTKRCTRWTYQPYIVHTLHNGETPGLCRILCVCVSTTQTVTTTEEEEIQPCDALLCKKSSVSSNDGACVRVCVCEDVRTYQTL